MAVSFYSINLFCVRFIIAFDFHNITGCHVFSPSVYMDCWGNYPFLDLRYSRGETPIVLLNNLEK